MKFTLKQLLSAILVLAIGVCVLFSCAGCATTASPSLRAAFPEHFRSDGTLDMFRAENEMSGAERDLIFWHR